MCFKISVQLIHNYKNYQEDLHRFAEQPQSAPALNLKAESGSPAVGSAGTEMRGGGLGWCQALPYVLVLTLEPERLISQTQSPTGRPVAGSGSQQSAGDVYNSVS